MTAIEKIKQAKRLLLQHPYSFPGGYEHALYLSDGARLCRDCLRENWKYVVQATLHNSHDGWAIMGVDIYWEGPPEQCAHCSKDLPSEYGNEGTES